MRILEKLDPYQYAPYRLYKESTRYIDGKHVKDLSHLNRDLSKVIIMDSNPDAYSLQPENSIAMKPWMGDPNDTELVAMIPFLESTYLSDTILCLRGLRHNICLLTYANGSILCL